MGRGIVSTEQKIRPETPPATYGATGNSLDHGYFGKESPPPGAVDAINFAEAPGDA